MVALAFDSNKQKLWILSVVKELLIEAGPSAILSSLRKAYPGMAVEGHEGFGSILSEFSRGNIAAIDVVYTYAFDFQIPAIDYWHIGMAMTYIDAMNIGDPLPSLNTSSGIIKIDATYAESQSPGMLVNDIVCLLGLYLYSSYTGDRRDAYRWAKDSRFSLALAEHSPRLSQLVDFLREAGDSRPNHSNIALHEGRSINGSPLGLSTNTNEEIVARPSVSGWLATILGFYLVATGAYTIAQAFNPFGGSSSSLRQTSKFLSDYGLLEENAPVTIVASYVVGAPIFFGVTMMAVGSIARRRR